MQIIDFIQAISDTKPYSDKNMHIVSMFVSSPE
jgi:hypothetical protein